MIERSKSKDGARRLRDFVLTGIEDGSLRRGQRLPTERELVARFATARSAARRTLAQLEAEGHITRGVGRGTFVAPAAEDLRRASVRSLMEAMHVSPAELMQARMRFEPEMAEMVVTHATAADFERMALCLERAERGESLDDFERWDAALHQAIAAATHNTLVVRVFDLFTAVREQAEWGKLKDRIVTAQRRLDYQRQHRLIVEALRDRDAPRAHAAIAAHLRYARRNLFGD